MVILLSTKLDLSQKVFDKFKELTTMRLSPVAMLKSVRIMLEIAAFYDYEIWQMDVEDCIPEWISGRRVVYDAT